MGLPGLHGYLLTLAITRWVTYYTLAMTRWAAYYTLAMTRGVTGVTQLFIENWQ